MLFPESGVRVWLCTQPTDMRKSYDGLSALVKNQLQENESLKQQLNWFKRQLFGEKSEKRLTIDNPDQIDLGEIFKTPADAPPPETETVTYERRKKQRPGDCVTDEGLRFDERVPVEVIELPSPELEREDANQYEVIDYKVTRKLAQRPGSYVVLEHRRPVVRHKPSQALTTVAAPSGIFDRSIADASLLAGMLIDKFVFHLPLHRQHQRMALSGVTLSRATLTGLVKRSIELLRPVHCRRYFDWAKNDEPGAVNQALEQIGKLYRIEKRIRESGITGGQKRQARQEDSRPLVDEFFNWCHRERQRPELTKTNPLSKALAYAENHQASLRVFLDDPGVQMDTNHLERLLRCIPMGRKNWMFCWTETGAEHVAIIQSLLVSCRLQDVDPYKYLVDVLQRVSLHPARQIDELIPRNWKERFGKNPLKAPLDK